MRRYAAVAHLVERHLAKVEVASSSLVGRSKNGRDTPLHMVAWPSGKAKVCKTFIHQFKSGRHLQKKDISQWLVSFFVPRGCTACGVLFFRPFWFLAPVPVRCYNKYIL